MTLLNLNEILLPVHHTLRSTVWWRTNVSRLTGASRPIGILGPAVGVRTTRIGLARIPGSLWHWRWPRLLGNASVKRVALVVPGALANGVVVHHGTLGVGAADAAAGVDANRGARKSAIRTVNGSAVKMLLAMR